MISDLNASDIMVEDLFYYEDYSPKERRGFCSRNDLDYLPKKSDKVLMRFEDPKFEEISDKNSNVIFDQSSGILEKEFTGPFHQEHVRFTLSDEGFVGVVHFSDYNCKEVYFEAYKLLYEIEQKLRYLLEKHRLEEDVEIKENSDEEFAHLSQAYFRGILRASYRSADELNLDFFKSMERKLVKDDDYDKDNDPLEELVAFRNRIMHAKEFVSLEEKSKRKSNYNFESFKRFLDSARKLEELHGHLDHLNDDGVHDDNVSLTRLR